MAQLGKAFIEVRADLSKFPAELRTQLEKALKEGTAGVSFKALDDKAGEAGKKAADTIGRELEGRSKTRLKKSGEKAGEDVGLGFFGVLHKLFSSNSSGSGFLSSAGDLFKGFTQSAEQGFSQLSDAGSKISEIGGKIGSAFSAIGSGIQVGLYVLAVPAVGALISILVQLLGILFLVPAAIGVIVAAIAPMIIAFHGVSDAIGAGFSGDVKKFNEALKGLAPSARSVVREIVGLKPAFEAIKNSTQQAFFAPLIGSFKALGSTLLPVLARGLSVAATALGNFAAQFLDLLTQPDILRDINGLFQSTASILDNLAPTVVELVGTMIGLIKVGLPYLEAFAEKVALAFQEFVDFFARAQGAGKIKDLINDALTPIKELGKLLAVVGDLFFTIFGNEAIKSASNGFIVNITKAIGVLDKFFKSAEGKKVLADFANAIEHTGQIAIGLVAAIIAVLEAIHYLNAGIGIGIKAIGAFFQAVGAGAVAAAKFLAHFVSVSAALFVDFFTVKIPAAFHAVVGFFEGIGKALDNFFAKTVPGWFDALVGFFEGLPGDIYDALKSFRDTLAGLIEGALKGMFDATTRGIGRVVGLFLASPYLIKTGLEKVGTFIHDAFFTALHDTESLVSSGLAAIGHYFTDVLPGQISSGLTFAKNFVVSQFLGMLDFLGGVGVSIGHFFESIYHSIVDNISAAARDAKNFVVNGFDAIVDFMGSLPGRVEALGPKLLNAAKSLGKAIGNGLKDIGNFASDIGRDIVNTVKSGINSVIDGINRGINDIDNSIPIGLPRLPHLAHGGVIDSPTIALLGEGSRREVVVPLTDPARAQQLAQQSGLTQVLAKGGGGTTVNVTAILGTGQILDILDQRVSTAMDEQGTELAYGAR